MVKDSYELSHPISVEIKNTNDITSLFDSISYDKVSVSKWITCDYNLGNYKESTINQRALAL